MFDPGQITLSQLSSSVRDFSIVGLIAGFVWQARGWFAKVERFYERIILHMTTMGNFANRALNNHLTHMEHDLRVLSGRKADVIEVDDSVGSTDTPGTNDIDKVI